MSVSTFAQLVAGVELSPVQRFVLKLLQEEELDDTVRDIEIEGSWLSHPIKVTEAEYLGFLFDDGRSTTAHQDGFREFYLNAGRRSGKTLLGSLNTAYTLADLVNRLDQVVPEMHPSHWTLCLMHIGRTNHVAKMHHRLLMDVVDNVGLLRRQMRNSGMNTVSFDPRGESTHHGQIKAMFRSSNAKGLRGHNNFLVTVDEADFIWNLQETYQATAPSLKVHQGKLVMMSSPNDNPNEKGWLFHRKITEAMEGQAENVLALQIPTWEMRPEISKEQCRDFAQTEHIFLSEYGAEFRARGAAA